MEEGRRWKWIEEKGEGRGRLVCERFLYVLCLSV